MTLPSGERSRDSFDLTEYENAYNEFSALLESEGNTERLLELFERIEDLVMDSKTDASLALYDRDMDITNKEYAEIYVSYGTLNVERINKKEDSYSIDYLYRYNV